MRKIVSFIFILISVFALTAGCALPQGGSAAKRSYSYVEADVAVGKSIKKVESFADIPRNYSYFDYEAKAKALDNVVFGFAAEEKAIAPSYDPYDQSTWTPVGFWVDQQRPPEKYEPLVTGYLKRSFGLPTYIGDNRVQSSGPEPITTISMVLGSSFAGIDKSDQVFGVKSYDFVEMTLKSYDTGSKLVKNIGVQGQSFWYDIFPQIMFARLYYIYDSVPYMKEMVLNGADEWLEALPYFVKDGKENYEFVGYNVVLESPTTVGDHIEPPNGGLAFLFYSAYEMTGEKKYFDGAKRVLDYLVTYPKNPNYEAMTDYAPFVAAAMNARYGTDYDVGFFLDYLFEGDSAFRAGWSVLSGDLGGYPVDGLVGQSGDYAFSMNSFHLASVLAPMVKYDVRYADAIGKYLLNLVSNAKIFFAENVPLSHQTMTDYLAFDQKGAVCYEGFRNYYNGVSGLAMGDATAMFGQPSDLSLYSSAFIGALGGMVEETDVKGILKTDLNNTDSFGANEYENYLLYNPYEVAKTVRFAGKDDRYDLFDSVTKKIVARNVKGSVNISIPARSSVVLVVLPAESDYIRAGNEVKVGGKTVARYQAAVNVDLSSRQELNSSSRININYSAPKNDEVIFMRIAFDDVVAYEGVPLNEYYPDKSILPDTDYTMKITIVTENGLTDTTNKRVVVR